MRMPKIVNWRTAVSTNWRTAVITAVMAAMAGIPGPGLLVATSSAAESQAAGQGRPPGTAGALDDFARARQAADAKDWTTALAIAHRLVESEPAVYDFRLFEARCLGWAGEHSRSADAFQLLYDRFPHRVEEYGAEWARQLLYGERAGESVDIATLLIALGAGDRTLGQDRALAYSWKGDTEAAVWAYSELHRRFPEDRAIRLAYARNLLWAERCRDADEVLGELPAGEMTAEERLLQGRIAAGDGRALEALRHYDAVIAGDNAGATGEIVDLAVIERARTLHDLGDGRGAVRLLDERFAGRDHRDAVELRTSIEHASAHPWVQFSAGTSEDSDDLEIRSLDVIAGWSPGLNVVAGGSFRIDALDHRGEERDIRRYGVLARWRGARVATRLHVRFGDVAGRSFAPVTATAGITWKVRDRLSASFDYERVDYESIRALDREVIGQFGTASVLLGLARRWDMVAGAGLGYVDGPGEVRRNRRVHALGELRHLLLGRPRLSISAGGYAFTFDERAADGYWNPDDFVSWSAGVDFNPVFGRTGFEAVLAGSAGTQRETPGGEWTSAGRFAFRGIYHPVRFWTLEYRFDTSDSKVDSDRGFARTGHTVVVSGTF